MGAADGEAAGVVAEVLEPALQLARALEDVVVIVAGEEVVFFAATLLRHRGTGRREGRGTGRGEGSVGQLAVGFVTANLEAFEDDAQVLFHLPGDEDDAVEVVGHELEGQHMHLGVVCGDGEPATLHLLA